MTREVLIEKLEKKQESLGEIPSSSLRFNSLFKSIHVLDPEVDKDLWSNLVDIVISLPGSLPLVEKELRARNQRISRFLSSARKRKGLLSDFHYTFRCLIAGIAIGFLIMVIFRVNHFLIPGLETGFSLLIGGILDTRARKMGRTL